MYISYQIDNTKLVLYFNFFTFDLIFQDVEGPVDIGMAALGINIYRNDQRECLFKW